MIGKSRLGGFATPAVLVLGLLLAACGTDATAPATQDSTGPFPTAFAPGDLSGSDPVVGEIRICKTGNVAGTFDFEWTPEGSGAGDGGVVADGFEIEPGECFTVAEDDGGDGFGRSVTITEVPSDYLQSITCRFVDANSPIEDCALAFENGDTRFVNSFHGYTLTFDNFQEPPAVCVGLTPGYWKNWENHYTEEQFASLLPGTIATDVADAEEILGYGGPDALAKLAKFVLANQLTMNLAAAIDGGDDLPNPDGAGLNGDCTILEYDGTLGDALAAALEMLENPEGLKKKDINALKDVLDMFANAD